MIPIIFIFLSVKIELKYFALVRLLIAKDGGITCDVRSQLFPAQLLLEIIFQVHQTVGGKKCEMQFFSRH